MPKEKKPSGDETSEHVAGRPEQSGRAFTFHGRNVEIMPARRTLKEKDAPAIGVLRIDGREVEYEQTDDGIYSHEAMYTRFSTPDELAEALVRRWGTHIPEPLPHHGHDHSTPKPAIPPKKNPPEGGHEHDHG